MVFKKGAFEKSGFKKVRRLSRELWWTGSPVAVFENENLKKYTYNAKNDINILKSIDIDLKNISFDTVLASYIKNPNRSHDLNAQALDYINHIDTKL